MTYSLKPLNLCRAGQTSRRVAVSHSDIMTGAWRKVTGRRFASSLRGHKEGGDTSLLFRRHQMLLTDRRVINTA